MKRRPQLALDIALSLIMGVIAWCVRAAAADQFVTWDEPAWVYRSVKFLLALQQGDLTGTSLVGHPGVTVMWSGALSLLWHIKVSGMVLAEQVLAIGAWPTLDVHDPTAIRQLVALLPIAKQGILFFHALITMVCYWLLARLLGRIYALISSLLLLLDPYYLGLARVLHMDALASGLMLCAVVSALLYARRLGRRYWIVSAGAAALAALTKSYGLFVAPAIGAIWLVAHLSSNDSLHSVTPRRTAAFLCRDLALWGLVAIAVFVALWPAMWVSPVETLRHMTQLSVEYATRPGDATTTYFRGAFVQDPGMLFYPTALLLRTTPLVMVGFVLALAGVISRSRAFAPGARRPVTLALLGYALIYLALITLSKKKFDRYLLPTLLGIDLIAAVGLVGVFDMALRAVGWRRRQLISAIAPLVLVGLQAALLLRPLAPSYYLAYYNPWAGGPAKAMKTIPVGWGEGAERAAEYLARKPNALELTVATWAIAGVAGAFPGQLVTLTEEHLPAADYVLLYAGDVQAPTPLVEAWLTQTPEFVATVNGVEYAWLYANTYYESLGREIDRIAAPDAVIVANAPSTLPSHYRHLPYVVLDGNDETQIAGQLRDAAHGAGHLVYLEYQSDWERNEWIMRQLAQYALLLQTEPFAYGEMRYYALPEHIDFQQVLASQPTSTNFGHQLLLEGYGFSGDLIQYRQALGLGLSWRVLRPIDENYHLFAYLVDGSGRKWSQHDLPLRDTNHLRTAAWQVDTLHLCNLTVPVEAGTPPGEYWVEIGLYRLDDLTRLDVFDDGGQKRGVSLRLGPVRVIAPTAPPDVTALAISHPLEVRLGDAMQVLGYDLASDRLFSGDALGLTLYWRCLGAMNVSYELGVNLERDGVIAQTWRLPPVGPQYPTEAWTEGEMLRYPHVLPLDGGLTSGDYQLTLNLYAEGSEQPLSARNVLLARVGVEHRERLFAAPPIQYPAQAMIGDEIAFLGYDLPTAVTEPGEILRFTLYWRASRRPRSSYTVFVHLLDEGGIVRGQRDSIPLGGQRSTDGWVEGEVLIDRYDIPIGADVLPGPYRIEIGMYDAATGERLAVLDANGAPLPERRILLDPILLIGE